MKINLSIGELVHVLRRRRKLTQIELAERIDVGQSTLSEIESGKVVPEPELLKRIKKELQHDL